MEMDKDQDASTSRAITVVAKYNFRGKNNDELCFKRNNRIVITQQPDGGWWEGTLNGKTGWFPSNYVEIENPEDTPRNLGADVSGEPVSGGDHHEVRVGFRSVILNDLIESETSHVDELTYLFTEVLKPLEAEALLPGKEFENLVSNLEDVTDCHKCLLEELKKQTNLPDNEKAVGKLFLNKLPYLKQLLKNYCENHPYSAAIINDKRDELGSFLQARNSSVLSLLQGLSKPFRRLERYPGYLQELERNFEASHPDRGDTQRCVVLYRNLCEFCADTRKQKELQLELLSGTFEDWDGASISDFGDIRLMANAKIAIDGSDQKSDRRLVLMDSVLLLFAASDNLNAYVFKQKIPLDGLITKADSETSFVLSGHNLEEKLIVSLGSESELSRFMEALHSSNGVTVDDTCNVISPSEPTQFHTMRGSLSPAIKPQISTMPLPDQAQLKKSNTLPATVTESFSANNVSQELRFPPKPWTGYCLRPNMAPRCTDGMSVDGMSKVKLRKKVPSDAEHQGDAMLLKVVEAYCASSVKSQMVGPISVAPIHHNVVNSPQVLVAEDEKMIIEETTIDGKKELKERTLVDTVYALKDNMDLLQETLREMQTRLEREEKSRRRLEDTIRKLSPGTLVAEKKKKSSASTTQLKTES